MRTYDLYFIKQNAKRENLGNILLKILFWQQNSLSLATFLFILRTLLIFWPCEMDGSNRNQTVSKGS